LTKENIDREGTGRILAQGRGTGSCGTHLRRTKVAGARGYVRRLLKPLRFLHMEVEAKMRGAGLSQETRGKTVGMRMCGGGRRRRACGAMEGGRPGVGCTCAGASVARVPPERLLVRASGREEQRGTAPEYHPNLQANTSTLEASLFCRSASSLISSPNTLAQCHDQPNA
jgi:hypothetical protein